MDLMLTAALSSASYTHEVCQHCGRTLYCSAAEPWHPQRDYGWCPHGDPESEETPEAVWTSPSEPDRYHRCEPVPPEEDQ